MKDKCGSWDKGRFAPSDTMLCLPYFPHTFVRGVRQIAEAEVLGDHNGH
jgi:hypothetical protein